MRDSRIGWVAMFLAVGNCAGSRTIAADGHAPATAPGAEAPPTAPHGPVASPGASVIVDEWGLVDVGTANGIAELSAGPGRPSRPLLARKPVLYVRTSDGMPVTLSVDVNVPGGALLESFPAGETRSSGIRWPSVTVASGACASPLAVPVACQSRDLFCETPELPNYIAHDTNCLDVSGTSSGLLFYRASIPATSLPLSITRDVSGELLVQSLSSLPASSYGIVRISTIPTDGGMEATHATVVARTQPTPLGGVRQPLDRASEIAAIRAHMIDAGLTAGEVDAFVRAWADDLFGGGVSRESTRMIAMPRARNFILYWLPAATVDAIAPLTITPAPSAVHRAWLVRVDVGA